MKGKSEITEKQKKVIAGAAIACFIIMTALVCWLVGAPMLRFVSEPEKFRAWVDANGVWGRLAYMGMVFVQVVCAVIPGEPLEIGGGYAFGAAEGTALCLIAAFAGSMAVFWLVRRFGIRLAEVFFSREKLMRLRFLQSSRKRDFIFLIIFMIPGTPKDMLCYFAGLTDIRLPVWLLICSLGRIPSVITSTVGGNALGTENYAFAAAVFVVTLAISAAGILVYRTICQRHDKQDK